MNDVQNFRSAFNGFHREDVVRYLGYLSTRHETQLSQLKEQAEALRQELAQLQSIKQNQADVEALQAQLAAAQAENAEKEQTIAGLQEQAQALREKVTSLEQTVVELRSTQAGFVPTPKGWTDAELAAYRRAEQTERNAQERAAALFGRANDTLTEAAAQIDASAEEMNKMTDHALESLSNLADSLTRGKATMLTAAATIRGVNMENQAK